MNTINPLQADTSTRCLKLKELLKRNNMAYEERNEGNAVVIDIKARPLSHQAAMYLNKLRSGIA